MLKADDTAVILVDVQGKLAELMQDKALLFESLSKLLRGARTLSLPVIWTEQIPAKMGPTIDRLLPHLEGLSPIPKATFSCCGAPAFLQALEQTGRRQILLAGIETHVCIYQTAADLVADGYHVEVVADAVSSRTLRNRELGLRRSEAAGAGVTSVEIALLELLRTAEHPRFRDILRIVK
jgi:nicotinamidase-related amidase